MSAATAGFVIGVGLTEAEQIDMAAQVLCSHLGEWSWEQSSERAQTRWRYVAEMMLGALENPSEFADYCRFGGRIEIVRSPSGGEQR